MSYSGRYTYTCPLCDRVSNSADEETRHLQDEHPDWIVEFFEAYYAKLVEAKSLTGDL